ncbi:MAG TPA: hypothetical protein DEF45_06255 [Rhodopirellula sp.]|nr:hypothetical protein [Rhodopirellula sp.]
MADIATTVLYGRNHSQRMFCKMEIDEWGSQNGRNETMHRNSASKCSIMDTNPKAPIAPELIF